MGSEFSETDSWFAEFALKSGTYAEVDLVHSLLRLIPCGEVNHALEFPLPAEKKLNAPSFRNWGQGLMALSGKGQVIRSQEWNPPLRYGLVLGGAEPILIYPEMPVENRLASGFSFFYPGYYRFNPAQGPWDLFASENQQWLVLSQGREGHLLLLDIPSKRLLAQIQIPDLAGEGALLAAPDPVSGKVFLASKTDSRIWLWQPGLEPQALKGDWRTPTALLFAQDKLWLLDAGKSLTLLKIDPQTSALEQRFPVAGQSFALSTDAPGDTLSLSPRGVIAVLSREDLPQPMGARLTCFQASRSEPLSSEVIHRGPLQIVWSVPNRALDALASVHPLNLLTQTQLPMPVQALIQSCGLDFSGFQSRMIVTRVVPGEEQNLIAGSTRFILNQIRSLLKKQAMLEFSDRLLQPAEQEILIHAERIARLLETSTQIEVSLYGLLGRANLHLSFLQSDFLSQSGADLSDYLAIRDWEQQEAEKRERKQRLAKEPVQVLPEGWLALPDPLNNRIIQLNSKLEIVWSLDTHLVGVYRPASVTWLDWNGFVVYDSESNEISAWNQMAQQEWALLGEDSVWKKILVLHQGEKLELMLLDSQNQDLLQINPEGETLWALREQNWCPEGVVDICHGPSGYFWLLDPKGQLSLFSLQGGPLRVLQAPADAQWLAASPDGQFLALMDTHQQKLWLIALDQRPPLCLELSKLAPDQRIHQPLGLVWRNAQELVLHDAFRLLVINPHSQEMVGSHLLQALKPVPGQNNLAPEEVFVAQAERNLNLRRGQKVSLLEMLARVPLFQQASESFLNAVRARVRTRIFNQGDVIVRKGEAGDELFLIRQGRVEVLSPNGQDTVAQMVAGDVFGEVALMLGMLRNATVRASEYCEVFSLSQKDLDQILLDFPEMRDRLFQLAQDRRVQAELRTEADQEKYRARLQNLRQKSQQTAPPSPAQPPSISARPDLLLWARHSQFGQLASVNRAGQVLNLIGPPQGLLQPLLALTAAQGLWVLDSGLNRLYLLSSETLQVETFIGSWGEIQLIQPQGLAMGADQSLWLLNSGAGQILHLDPAGNLLEQFSHGRAPSSLQILANGNLLVSDSRQHTVSELLPTGELIWQYGTPRRFGRAENQLFVPEDAKRLENGNTLIADTGNNRVLEVSPEGRITWALLSGGELKLPRPSQVFRLSDGATLIEFSNRFRWLEVSSDQQLLWKWSLPIQGFAS